MQRVCVYCGSNSGKRPEYTTAAYQLVDELLQRNIGLVYGGAHVGIMGEIANRMLAQGGEVIGVIPQTLIEKEVAHRGLTELHTVSTMHERKALMTEAANGFIALPGGWGTLDELFEMLTWAQLGLHQKPCALVNTLGYYDHLAAFMRHAVEEQFVQAFCQEMLIIGDNPANLLDAMQSYQPPCGEKWIK